MFNKTNAFGFILKKAIYIYPNNFPFREFKLSLLMRIFTKTTLRNFWRMYPDSKAALEFWHDTVESTIFKTPNDVIKHFKNADTVGNNRIVFNINQNKYRLIAKFEYDRQLAYVRFIGTHKEYDKIKNIQNI